MKKLQLFTCFGLLTSLFLNAQTNTFPTSGNVGVGTLNPTTKIAIQGDDQSLSVAFNSYNYSTTQPIGAKFGSWQENSASGIKFHRWLGSGSNFQVAYIGQSHYDSDYGLDFRTNTLSSFGDATTSRMYIKATNGHIGIGTISPETLLNVNVGSGGNNSIAGIRIGGLNNYASLELGVNGDYDGMIRSYGNNIRYYAGHWRIIGTVATEDHIHAWYTSKSGSKDWSNVKMILNQDGNLGLGTVSPDAKLTVKGDIHTKEVKVDLLGAVAPDYVFHKDYDLKSLKDVEDYISINGHLPNIPSAMDMEINGILLKEMNLKLLEKIEELTLYAIDLEKSIKVQEQEVITFNEELQNQKLINKDLENRLREIETLLNSKK